MICKIFLCNYDISKILYLLSQSKVIVGWQTLLPQPYVDHINHILTKLLTIYNINLKYCKI